MSNSNEQKPSSDPSAYANFMVLEGSDGTIYQIPLDELQKFKIPEDEAKLYARTRASSISCRIKCR